MTRILDRPVPVEPYWRRVPGAEPLLQAIALNPDDDATHLVLADLCDDCGEHARAEFIRASVGPARLGLKPHQADVRAGELLAFHGVDWGEGLPDVPGLDWCDPERFVGGLLCSVYFGEVPADEDVRAVLDAIDVRHIHLGTVEAPMSASLAALLRDAVCVTLDECAWVGDDYHDLVAAVAAGNVRSLTIENVEDRESLLDALTSTPAPRSLDALDLSFTALSAEEVETLLSAPLLRQLRRLTLWCCDLHPDAVRRIAAWQGGRSLVSLDLSGNPLFDTGALALASSAHLAGLHELRLDGCKIGVDGTLALGRSATLSAVETFVLSANRIGPEAAALGGRILDGDLIDLEETRIGDAGLSALLAAWGERACRRLILYSCDLTATGVAALVGHPALASIEDLRLGNNPIGDDGARLLASSPRLGSLRNLGVDYGELTGVGVGAILSSPNMRYLERLNVMGQTMTAGHIRAIATGPRPPELKSLCLTAEPAAEDAVEELRAAFKGVADLTVHVSRT